MPAEFDFPLTNEVWAPLSIGLPEQTDRSRHTLGVLALLKPQVSVEQARSEAARIAARLERQYRKLMNRAPSRSFLCAASSMKSHSVLC